MLNKQLKQKTLRRSVSDISPGKSVWKNVASVVSSLRSNYGGCYSETRARESLVLGEINYASKVCQCYCLSISCHLTVDGAQLTHLLRLTAPYFYYLSLQVYL